MARQRVPSRDEGVALVAAMGVAIVVLVLAMAVVTVTVRGVTSTGAGRDRTQAGAAAEAGVDTVTAQLRTLTGTSTSADWCATAATSSVSVSTSSTYDTAVTFWASQTDMSDPTKALLCGSAGTGAAFARVVATGTARTGSGVPQVQKRQAVLQLTPQSSTSGPGILGNTVDLSQAGFTVLSRGTSGLGVRVATGAGSCASFMNVSADVVVSNGAMLMSDSCDVHGSVKAAAGLSTGSMSSISGSVLTKPAMPVTVGSYSSIGSVSTSASDPAWSLPALPRITDTLDAWTSQGFTVRPWTGACSVGSYATLTLNQSSPTIYDTRTACPTGLTGADFSTMTVRSADVVLLVNGFKAGSYFNLTSDTTGRRVWIISPAPVSGGYCPTPHDLLLQSYSTSASGVRLFLYSPCTVTVGSFASMTGQVWGGAVKVLSYATITFADVGIASAGGTSTGTTVVRVSTS